MRAGRSSQPIIRSKNSQHGCMNLPDLHARLQNIVCTEDIDEHPSAIDNLKSEFPHTIQLIERTNPTRPRNCYEWALDLSSVLTQWVGELRLQELFAGLQFVSTLIPYLKEIPESDVRNDDLVLYFDDQIPTHAGLATESRVISKWGKVIYTSMASWKFHQVMEMRLAFTGIFRAV